MQSHLSSSLCELVPGHVPEEHNNKSSTCSRVDKESVNKVHVELRDAIPDCLASKLSIKVASTQTLDPQMLPAAETLFTACDCCSSQKFAKFICPDLKAINAIKRTDAAKYGVDILAREHIEHHAEYKGEYMYDNETWHQFLAVEI